MFWYQHSTRLFGMESIACVRARSCLSECACAWYAVPQNNLALFLNENIFQCAFVLTLQHNKHQQAHSMFSITRTHAQHFPFLVRHIHRHTGIIQLAAYACIEGATCLRLSIPRSMLHRIGQFLYICSLMSSSSSSSTLLLLLFFAQNILVMNLLLLCHPVLLFLLACFFPCHSVCVRPRVCAPKHATFFEWNSLAIGRWQRWRPYIHNPHE